MGLFVLSKLRKAPDWCAFVTVLLEQAARMDTLASGCSLKMSGPGVDLVPTFTTNNDRMCLVLANGQMGLLRTEDAERLQGMPIGHTEACWPIHQPGIHQHRAKGMPIGHTEVCWPIQQPGIHQHRAKGMPIGHTEACWPIQQPGIHQHRAKGMPIGHTVACWPIQQPGIHQHRAKVKDADAGARERERFGLLGNAVTVQVSKWLGDRLMDPHRAEVVKDVLDMHLAVIALWLFDEGDPVVRLMKGTRIRHYQIFCRQAGFAYGLFVLSWLCIERDPVVTLRENTPLPALLSPDTLDRDVAEHPLGPKAPEETHDGDELPAVGERVERYGRGRSGNAQAQGWPRAAWFVRGMGRHGVEDMSEVPLKVGPRPPAEALTTYFMRLREQGWNVNPTLTRVQNCGGRMDMQVNGVSRLAACMEAVEDKLGVSRIAGCMEAVEDKLGVSRLAGCMEAVEDKLGELVWVKDVARSSMWWPAQLLDPFNLPPGVTLTNQQVMALSSVERNTFLPSSMRAPLSRPEGEEGAGRAQSPCTPPQDTAGK
eukprot:gene8364-2607_t